MEKAFADFKLLADEKKTISNEDLIFIINKYND